MMFPLLSPIPSSVNQTRPRFTARNPNQFQWRVIIQQNLSWLFGSDPNMFVVGDLFWYPVATPGVMAMEPDVMIVVGRVRGRQNPDQPVSPAAVEPLVVFDICAPRAGKIDLDRKLLFYERYGAAEYYTYDPNTNSLRGWLLENHGLQEISDMSSWVSPYLGVRFARSPDTLCLYRPNGTPFASYDHIVHWAAEFMLRFRPADSQRSASDAGDSFSQPTHQPSSPSGLSLDQVAQALGLTTGVMQGMA